MNKKALDKDSLQVLFDKYEHVVNKNEIRFLGEVVRFKPKKDGVGKQLPNPNYRDVVVKDDNGEVVKKFKTGRVVIEIPSPFRMDENQQLYPTKLSVFTTDYGVDNFQEVLPKPEKNDEQDTARKWIFGIGRVQSHNVVANITTDNEILSFLRSISVRKYGCVKEDKLMEMAKVLHVMGGIGDVVLLPATNIWCDEIADACDIVPQYEEKNVPVQENSVLLQGLVYMPPSIKTLNNGELCIHFKLRVKRQVEAERNVPIMQESQNGYDIINVIGFGDNAETWFENIEQGHPVKVLGRLESSRYVSKLKVNERMQQELGDILEVPVGDSLIQDIVRFVDSQKRKISRPAYNVWANEIVTDENMLDKE